MIGNVLIYYKAENIEEDFSDYKNDFETLENLFTRKIIEEDNE